MSLRGACGWETIDAQEAVAATSGGGVSYNESDLSGQVCHHGWGALVVEGDGSTAASYEWQPRNNSDGACVGLNDATLYSKFWFYIETLPASGNPETFFSVRNSTNRKLYLTIGTDGKIHARDGSGNLLADGATALSTGTWYIIQVKCGTGSSAAYEVKIGTAGTTPASEFSGTANLLSSNVDRVCFGNKERTGSAAFKFIYDDFACDNAEYPPDILVDIMSPVANGTVMGWSGPGGYAKVSDNPNDGDTTYRTSSNTSGSTIDQTVTEVLADRSVPSDATIVGVLFGYAVRRTAGTNPTLRYGCYASGANFWTDSSNYPGTAYVLRTLLALVDPATEEAWSQSAVDDAETAILDNFTSTHTFRCTQHFKQVYWYLAPVIVSVSRVQASSSILGSSSVPAPAVCEASRIAVASSIPGSQSVPSPAAIGTTLLSTLLGAYACATSPAAAAVDLDRLSVTVEAEDSTVVPAPTAANAAGLGMVGSVAGAQPVPGPAGIDVLRLNLSLGALSPEVVPSVVAILLDRLGLSTGTFAIEVPTMGVISDVSQLVLQSIAMAVLVQGGVLILPDGRTVSVASDSRRIPVAHEDRLISVAADNRRVPVGAQGVQ